MARTPSVAGDVLSQVMADDDEASTEAVTTNTDKPDLLALDGRLSVPVSRKSGKRWKQILDEALEAYGPERKLWDQAMNQYRKVTEDVDDAFEGMKYKFTTAHKTDENLVRETVKLMLRNTYTRNPRVEFSTEDTARKPMANVLKLAINALMERANYPGVNARGILRRVIVHTHLTNFGVIKLTYQEKQGSRQEALQVLATLQKKLSEEKDPKEIELLYAQLEEVEETLPLLANRGICLSACLPNRIILDPACTRYDTEDANWAIEEISLKTSYIRSRYMRKTDDGLWVRLSDGKGKQRETSDDADAKKVEERVTNKVLGYTTEEREAYLAKDATKCYLIYDKLARQILLFSDDDWTYPLWVWQDDLNISQFFPFFIVGFTEPVDGIVQPGETSFYAGQQSEINLINRKVSQIRNSIFGAIIYNSKDTNKPEIERLIRHLRNPREVEAFALDFDPEKKLEDIVHVFAPPAYEYKDLFDKTNHYNIINRTASVTDAMRGEQFKVNTNTTAVNTYNNAATANTGELTDIVEDVVGRLAWAMAEILVSKYTKEDVAYLIGAENAAAFQQMEVSEFNASFSMEVAAGSSEKPTSEQKKKDALEVAQAVGQMGQAAPGASLSIILRMFSEAFSDFLVTEQDWKQLGNEIASNMTKGVSQPTGASPAKPPQATRGPENATE